VLDQHAIAIVVPKKDGQILLLAVHSGKLEYQVLALVGGLRPSLFRLLAQPHLPGYGLLFLKQTQINSPDLLDRLVLPLSKRHHFLKRSNCLFMVPGNLLLFPLGLLGG
jgi:hypothetical protein